MDFKVKDENCDSERWAAFLIKDGFNPLLPGNIVKMNGEMPTTCGHCLEEQIPDMLKTASNYQDVTVILVEFTTYKMRCFKNGVEIVNIAAEVQSNQTETIH